MIHRVIETKIKRFFLKSNKAKFTYFVCKLGFGNPFGFVIASVAWKSVSLRAKDFKHPLIIPTDWFNETPIRASQ